MTNVVIDGAVTVQAKLENGAIYNIKGVLAASSALDHGRHPLRLCLDKTSVLIDYRCPHANCHDRS